MQVYLENMSKHGKATLQSKLQLSFTIFQWFLHVEAVGWLCMPTNDSSKGGELLVIWQLSTSSPTHDLTHATCLQTSNLCLPLYSFDHQIDGLSFRMSHRCLGTCLKTGFQTMVPRAYPTYYSTTVLYFVTNLAYLQWMRFVINCPL